MFCKGKYKCGWYERCTRDNRKQIFQRTKKNSTVNQIKVKAECVADESVQIGVGLSETRKLIDRILEYFDP